MSSSTRLLLVFFFFIGITVVMMDCGRRMKLKRTHPPAAPTGETIPTPSP